MRAAATMRRARSGLVQRGAGAGALIPDEAFAEAGAELVDDGAV